MNRRTYICGTDTYKAGDPAPTGYMEKQAWAEVQHKAGLRQTRCKTCMLWLYPGQRKDHVCVPREKL